MKVMLPIHAASETEKRIKFEGGILLLGFGGVGRAIVPGLFKHMDFDASKMTIIEKHDNKAHFESLYGETGIEYVQLEIVRKNMDNTLAKYLKKGDLLINLSLNVDGIEITRWCLENGVMYIDTSIERWPDQPDENMALPARTLYTEHAEIRKMAQDYKGGPTCVVTHGANPGLVSHFVKAALMEMAEFIGHKVDGTPVKRADWALLMQDLGVSTIHISERDTQIIDEPKKKNEFVNTWSCEGFWAEGRAPAEMGWGTHEPELPRHAFEHKTGPMNAIYFDKPGVAVMSKTWAPKAREFNGFCVQHSEAITISEYFTVIEKGKATYRPTVHYVYCPCDAAIVSVHEFRGKELHMQSKTRIAREEIVSGIDELGVLLLGERVSWWYGSQLGINKSRELLPENNATTLQVVASLLAAIGWMIENPSKGYCEPEDLPHEYILERAWPYLGPMVSTRTKWKPTQNINKLFPRTLNNDDPWAFANFRVY